MAWWVRQPQIEAPVKAVAEVAAALLGRVEERTFIVGDPVLFGLLGWHAGRRRGGIDFPDVDGWVAGRDGAVVNWTGLPGDAVAEADRRWPGFAELVGETVLSADELARAYPDPEVPRCFRPFQREMLRQKWAGKPDPRRPGIVYHHVPKCAGMSMFHHLNAQLRWNDELVHLDARARADVLAAGCVPYEWKDPRELARIEVLFGHEVSRAAVERLGPRELRLVTCLREPAGRMVSHFNWEMHQRELTGERMAEFPEWYEWQERNWITRWLGRSWLGLDVDALGIEAVAAAVDEALRGFWIVGTTRDFGDAMRPVTEALGLPPVSGSTNAAGESYPRRFVLDDAWRERIRAEHGVDAALVDRWEARG